MSDESSIDSDDFVWNDLDSSGPDKPSSASACLQQMDDDGRWDVERLAQKLFKRSKTQHSAKSSIDFTSFESGRHSRMNSVTRSRTPSDELMSNIVRVAAYPVEDEDIDSDMISALEKIANQFQPSKSLTRAQSVKSFDRSGSRKHSELRETSKSLLPKHTEQSKTAIVQVPLNQPLPQYDAKKTEQIQPLKELKSDDTSAAASVKKQQKPLSTLHSSDDPPSLSQFGAVFNEAEQKRSLGRQSPDDVQSLSQSNATSKNGKKAKAALAENSTEDSASNMSKVEQKKTTILDSGSQKKQKIAENPQYQTPETLLKLTNRSSQLEQIANASIDDILGDPDKSLQIFSPKSINRCNIEMPKDDSNNQQTSRAIVNAHDEIQAEPEVKQQPKNPTLEAPWLPHKKIPLSGRQPASPPPCRTKSHSCPNCVHKKFYDFPRRQLEMALIHAVRCGVDVERLMQFMKEDPGTEKLDAVIAVIMKLRSKPPRPRSVRPGEKRRHTRTQPGEIE